MICADRSPSDGPLKVALAGVFGNPIWPTRWNFLTFLCSAVLSHFLIVNFFVHKLHSCVFTWRVPMQRMESLKAIRRIVFGYRLAREQLISDSSRRKTPAKDCLGCIVHLIAPAVQEQHCKVTCLWQSVDKKAGKGRKDQKPGLDIGSQARLLREFRWLCLVCYGTIEGGNYEWQLKTPGFVWGQLEGEKRK